MPFQPYIEARFAEPFVDNLERIIRRDYPGEDGAGVWAGAAADFEQYVNDDAIGTAWPLCRVVIRNSDIVWKDTYLEETHAVAIEVEVTGEREGLKGMVQRRLRAVDMILRTVWERDKADFMQGYVGGTFALLEFNISRHEYASGRRPASLYWQAGGFLVTMKMWEAITNAG